LHTAQWAWLLCACSMPHAAAAAAPLLLLRLVAAWWQRRSSLRQLDLSGAATAFAAGVCWDWSGYTHGAQWAWLLCACRMPYATAPLGGSTHGAHNSRPRRPACIQTLHAACGPLPCVLSFSEPPVHPRTRGARGTQRLATSRCPARLVPMPLTCGTRPKSRALIDATARLPHCAEDPRGADRYGGQHQGAAL
jgi:hypothetical protein